MKLDKRLLRCALQCARINNVTGRIALCGLEHVSIYSLNAKLLIKEKVCGNSKEDGSEDKDVSTTITSCAFYEGVGNEWLARDLFFTGHSNGNVNVSERSFPNLFVIKQDIFKIT